MLPSWLSDKNYRNFPPAFDFSQESTQKEEPQKKEEKPEAKKKGGFVLNLFNFSQNIYTPPQIDPTTILNNFPREADQCLRDLKELRANQQVNSSVKKKMEVLADQIDRLTRDFLIAFQKKSAREQREYNLTPLRNLAEEIKKSPIYGPIWDKLTIKVKELFQRIVPFSVTPNSRCDPQYVKNQEAIASNNVDQSCEFQGSFNDHYAYKLHMRERGDGFSGFLIGIEEGKYTLRAMVPMPNNQEQAVQLPTHITNFFGYDSSVNPLSQGQMNQQKNTLLLFYRKKILDLLGFPMDLPLSIGMNGEYFIQKTGQEMPLMPLFLHDASCNQNSTDPKAFENKQRSFARTIIEIFELESLYGIQILNPEEDNLDCLFTVRNEVLYPVVSAEPLSLAKPEAIMMGQKILGKKLITRFKEKGFVAVADELKPFVDKLKEITKKHKKAVAQPLKNPIQDLMKSQNLTWDQLKSLRFPEVECLRLISEQENDPVVAARPAEQLFEEVYKLSKKLIVEMPKAQTQPHPETDLFSGPFRSKTGPIMDAHFNDQAQLSILLRQLFQAYVKQESNLSLEQVMERYFLSKDSIFQKLEERLNQDKEVLLLERDSIRNAAEYFSLIFWEPFVNHFQYQVKTIAATPLLTCFFHARSLLDIAKDDKEKLDAATVLEEHLHKRLIERDEQLEKSRLLDTIR